MATENRIFIEVELDQKQAEKEAVRLTKVITQQRAELAKYRKILKESGGTNDEAAKQVATLSQEIRENNQQLRQNQKEAKAVNNSTQALRLETNRLNKDQSKLNTSTEEGRREFERLEQQLQKNREQLNANSKAAGSFKDNIGNYTNSIKEALSANTLFTDGLGDAAKGFDLLVLAGGPITILIAAITTALTAFFTQTEEGQKIFRSLSAIVQATFGVIFKAIGEGVEGLIKFVQSVNSVGEAFDAVGDAISNFSFQSLVDGASDFADELEKAAIQADRLAQRQLEIEKQEIKLAKLAAEQQRLAEEARKNRDDETKSFSERLAFNNQVLVAERERRRILTAINSNQQESIKNQLRQTTNVEERLRLRRELAELEVEFQEIQEDFAGRTTEQLTEENSLRRELLQTQANLEKARLEQRLIDEALSAEKILQIRLQVLDKEREAALVGLKEGSIQAELVEQEFLNKRLGLRKEFDDQLTEQIKESNNERAEVQTVQAQEAGDKALEQLKTRLTNEKIVKDQALAQDKARAEARRQITQQQLASLSQLTDGVVSAFGEQTAAGKAAALAQVAINLPAEISNILKANSIFPEPFGSIIKGAQVALAVTRAGQNIAQINSVSGFADGGAVDQVSGQRVPLRSFAKGGSTGSGGTYQPKGAVHGGEFVVPKRQVKALGGMKAVSAMTGTPVKGFATGGAVGRNITNSVNQATIASQIEQAVSGFKFAVAVTDINKAEKRYAKVQDRSNR